MDPKHRSIIYPWSPPYTSLSPVVVTSGWVGGRVFQIIVLLSVNAVSGRYIHKFNLLQRSFVHFFSKIISAFLYLYIYFILIETI